MKISAYTQVAKMVINEMHSNNDSDGKPLSKVEQRHNWGERCWWIVVFGGLICFTCISIDCIWIKWETHPILMELRRSSIEISTVPFPTVTICPKTKTSKDKLDLVSIYRQFETSKQENNLSAISLSRIEALAHICKYYPLVHGDLGEKFANESIYQVIRDMAPSCNDIIPHCEWSGKTYPCSELFKPMFTEKGVCFVFNSLNVQDVLRNVVVSSLLTVVNNPNSSHWNRHTLYMNHSASYEEYPRRSFSTREEAGLIVYLRTFKQDIEYVCRGPFQGFRIVLSTPGQTIKMFRESIQIPFSENAVVSVKPTSTHTSKKLYHLEPEKRECFFDDERYLRFFKFYAKHNCEVECLTNFTLRECGCVKFSMPRDESMKICGAQSVKCYEKADKRLYGEDVHDGVTDSDAKLYRQQCNCLPGCFAVSYTADVSSVHLNLENWLPPYKAPIDRISEFKYSRLAIRFAVPEVETLKRAASYTTTNFLAECGGLLGLFLGFSVLSIARFTFKFMRRLLNALRQWKVNNIAAPFHRNVTINNHTIIDIHSEY